MARLVVGAIGAVIGFYLGGPVGAVQGFTIAYGLSAGLDPNAQVLGPKLQDLKAPTAGYGAPIAYIEGAPRLAGNFVYASAKREVAKTTTEGKGGNGVDTTLFTYEIDCLVVLAINQCQGIRRIWSNGKLVYTRGEDATINSLIASAGTPSWRDIRFYFGEPTQLPDPTYEAAVGVGNAPAYRGRTSVFIEGLNLGNSGQLPVLTFEVCSEIVPSSVQDTLGMFVSHRDYTQGAIFVDHDGGVTIHQHQGDSFGGTRVYVRQMSNTGVVTEAGTGVGYNSLEQSAGKGTLDRSIGVFFGNTPGFGQGKVMVYEDDGNQSLDGRTPNFYDSGGGIYTLSGDFLYVTGSNIGGTVQPDIYRMILGHQDPLAVGNTTGVAMYTMAVLGADLWAKPLVGSALYRFNSVTLALDPTAYSVPEASTTNGCELLVRDGKLYYALRGATADGKLYRGDGINWLLINPHLKDAAPGTATSKSAIVGEIVYRYSVSGSNDTAGQVYRAAAVMAPADIALSAAVSRLCLGTGQLGTGDIDVTSISGLVLRAMAISQVSTARVSLQTLMQSYLFECAEGEKLRFVLRGGAAVATIPYADLGMSPEGDAEPLPKRRANDIEIAARFSVKYANVLNDFQDGLEAADRLVTASTSDAVVEVPLGLRPVEAKRLADANTLDAAVSLLQIGPISLSRAYAALEPTDVVNIIDSDGSTFRARIVKGTIGSGLNTFELLLDDATVVNSAAATDDDYVSTALVRIMASTELDMLDIPILRDEDDHPGVYAEFSADGGWAGAQLDRSSDNITFAKLLTATSRGVVGTATTALGTWDGENSFDEINSVTVNVGAGVLSSSSRTALLNSTVNAMAIGRPAPLAWEIVQFRDALLMSPGVYRLSGLLRGRRGTEWAMGLHVAGERVLLLDEGAGIFRVDDSFTDLNVPYYWLATTSGKRRDPSRSELFADTGVSQKPFAPTDLRRDFGADAITWQRRSRLASRFLSPTGDPRLGEDTESYDVELRNASSVIVNSATTTSRTYSLTPWAPAPGYTVTVYQRSATVGRGYSAVLTL